MGLEDSYSVSRYLKLASRCKAFRATVAELRKKVEELTSEVEELEREIAEGDGSKTEEKAEPMDSAPAESKKYIDDSDLGLWHALKPMDEETHDKLFPTLPKDYFKDRDDILSPRKPSSFEEAYDDAEIKPYIKVRDFNRQGPTVFEDDRPYVGYEGGISVKF